MLLFPNTSVGLASDEISKYPNEPVADEDILPVILSELPFHFKSESPSTVFESVNIAS